MFKYKKNINNNILGKKIEKSLFSNLPITVPIIINNIFQLDFEATAQVIS